MPAPRYRGCIIFWTTPIGRSDKGYVWEDTLYGAESDDSFATVAEAKADIDRWFGAGSAPRVINNEIEV